MPINLSGKYGISREETTVANLAIASMHRWSFSVLRFSSLLILIPALRSSLCVANVYLE